MEAYDADSYSEEIKEEAITRICKNRGTSTDTFDTLNHTPSDSEHISAGTIIPEMQTLQLQPPKQRNQKLRSFDKIKSLSTLRICSWNICGLGSNIQMGGFDYLLRENPDIIALQEEKCPNDERARKARLPAEAD